jgi:hypothetical protein
VDEHAKPCLAEPFCPAIPCCDQTHAFSSQSSRIVMKAATSVSYQRGIPAQRIHSVLRRQEPASAAMVNPQAAFCFRNWH